MWPIFMDANLKVERMLISEWDNYEEAVAHPGDFACEVANIYINKQNF